MLSDTQWKILRLDQWIRFIADNLFHLRHDLRREFDVRQTLAQIGPVPICGQRLNLGFIELGVIRVSVVLECDLGFDRLGWILDALLEIDRSLRMLDRISFDGARRQLGCGRPGADQLYILLMLIFLWIGEPDVHQRTSLHSGCIGWNGDGVFDVMLHRRHVGLPGCLSILHDLLKMIDQAPLCVGRCVLGQSLFGVRGEDKTGFAARGRSRAACCR